MLDCLVRQLGPTWKSFLRVWLPILLAVMGILVVQGLYTGDWTHAQMVLLAYLGAGAVALISMIIVEAIICAAEQPDSLSSGTSSTSVFPGALGSSGAPVDCPTAKAALDNAKAREASAQAAFDNLAAQVRHLQDVVSGAKIALSLALYAVAVAAFFPVALPTAITFAVAAGVVLWGAVKALSAAVADLNKAALILGAARAAVAAAEALVAQACSVTVVPTPTRPGATTNALAVLAGLHDGHD
jgi:hypothetical protein